MTSRRSCGIGRCKGSSVNNTVDNCVANGCAKDKDAGTERKKTDDDDENCGALF